MKTIEPSPAAPDTDVPFGSNEMRLNGWHWLAVFAIVGLMEWLTPRLWERIEKFDTGPDYRIPYPLSNDYWLYGRRLRQVAEPDRVIVIGDSVVWGEYVLPDGTLSHFLNQEAGATDRFINAGVNGFFPLALEGLIQYYGHSLQRQKVMVQCNVLWLTSPKADLSTDKEESFNHTRLVPQFSPRIPCYRANAHERLSALVEREIPFLGWISHVQNAYFGQKSIPGWTLENDGGEPPRYLNAYKNPLAQITLAVPSAPTPDPQRGPQSPRHKPWSVDGRGTTQFEWVDPDASLQWQAFQRTILTLKERGNDVLVILGPFNEHLMTPENRAGYRRIHDRIATWLAQNRIPCVAPEILPTALYADASHPLTEGYALLAKQIYGTEDFRSWLRQKP